MQGIQQTAQDTFSIIEEDDNRRRLRMLNIFLGGVVLSAVVILTLAVIFRGNDEEGALFVFISTPPVIIISGFLYYFAKNNVQLASITFVTLLILGTLFSDTPEQVLEGRSLFFMIAPIMISSFIIRPNSSGFAALGAVLGLFFLAFSSGLPMNYIGAVGFFIFAFVSWLAASAYENTLTELIIINQELDQRVENRTVELAEANERLTELDRLKSKFVSDVSHELRTPISNIHMYLEMFDLGDPEKYEQYLEVLKEDTKRLIKLVKNTLDLSRLEMGETKNHYAFRDLNLVCRMVVTTNDLRASAKGLDLTFVPSFDLPNVWIDTDQMTQVVSNLVANAINYTSMGSIIVTTYQDKHLGHVCVNVQDTGYGIPAADIEHLFDRFYRGERASQSSVPGSGLGLAISKEIVEMHNGKIEVESEIGVGTVFTVSLPLILNKSLNTPTNGVPKDMPSQDSVSEEHSV